VYGEQLVLGFGHEEVSFLVDVEVSTTSETGDVGIVPDGARLVYNRCLRSGGELLALASNGGSSALENDVVSGSALQGTLDADARNTLVTSLYQLLV